MKRSTHLHRRMVLCLVSALILVFVSAIPVLAADAAPAAAKQPLIISNESIRSLNNGTGEYTMMATVENPNSEWSVYQTKYSFLAYDAAGKEVLPDGPDKHPEYTIHVIPPHAKVNVFASNTNGRDVSTVKLQIKTINWEKLNNLLPEFSLTAVDSTFDKYSVNISGLLASKTATSCNAWAVVTIYDKNGVMVNGRHFELKSVGIVGKPTPFKFVVWGNGTDLYSKYSLQIIASDVPQVGY